MPPEDDWMKKFFSEVCMFAFTKLNVDERLKNRTNFLKLLFKTL